MAKFNLIKPKGVTRSFSLICVIVVLGLFLADCSPDALGLSNILDDATETPTVVDVPGATEAPFVSLKVSSNAALGSFLTDQTGFSLYSSKKDSPGISNCTGTCLHTWPAVRTSGALDARDPLIKGKVDVINRPDGGQQVTYNGLPLYYYLKDNIPGDVFGQGVNSDWYLVAP